MGCWEKGGICFCKKYYLTHTLLILPSQKDWPSVQALKSYAMETGFPRGPAGSFKSFSYAAYTHTPHLLLLLFRGDTPQGHKI